MSRVRLHIVPPGASTVTPEAPPAAEGGLWPLWRAEPFRPFFVLGLVLGWLGVTHWLLYTTSLTTSYSGMSHALVQMQSFVLAFACGFLMTAVPRRTRTAPPNALEMGGAALLLAASAAAALAERWVIAELAYLGVLAVLAQFAVRRFLRSPDRRPPPNGFVLVPVGLLNGAAGAVLLVAHHGLGAAPWTVGLGRQLVQQGLFLCLVLGIGTLVLPLVRGDTPPHDPAPAGRDRRAKLGFLAAGLLVTASFPLELWVSTRLGLALRAFVCAAALAIGGGAWRWPKKPGLHRPVVVIATWLVPLGLASAALFPEHRVGALHVLFIGGFGLLTFAVATHVTLSHAGPAGAALGNPPAVAALATLFGAALLLRLAAESSAESYFAFITASAAVWLAATLAWATFLLPRLLGAKGEP